MKKSIVYLDSPTTAEQFDGGGVPIYGDLIIKIFYAPNLDVANIIGENHCNTYFNDIDNQMKDYDNRELINVVEYDLYNQKEITLEDYLPIISLLNKINVDDLYLKDNVITYITGEKDIFNSLIIPDELSKEMINEYTINFKIK